MLKPYYKLRRYESAKYGFKTKCPNCSKWFVPKSSTIANIALFVNGITIKQTSFYCSPACGYDCNGKRSRAIQEWHKTLELFDTDIEVLIYKDLVHRRAYFNRMTKNNTRSNYLRSISQSVQITKRRKKKKEQKKETRRIKRKEREIERIAIDKRKAYRLINAKMPTDPEERKEYQKIQVKQHLEKMKLEEPKRFKIRKLIYYSRARAKEKNIPHTITKEWLKKQLENNICELTNLKFSYDQTILRNPFGPSIDRINITKGYTPNNCRLVLWAVNAGLGHFGEKDLYYICKAYLEYNKIKHNSLIHL